MEQSKYTIIETENGFRVEHPERNTVVVKLATNKTHFVVSSLLTKEVDLFRFRYLLSLITSYLWYGRLRDRSISGFPNYYKWRNGKTSRALNRRIHVQWERLLGRVPDTVLQVKKAVFSAYPMWDAVATNYDWFYEDPYWVRDVIQHRAAALTAHLLNPYAFNVNIDLTEFEPKAIPHLKRDLSDWMGYYAKDGDVYTSLSRTLMNVPGNIPPSLLRNLKNIRLERPIIDRVELLSLLFVAGLPDENHVSVYMHATREQLLRAFKKVADHLRQDKPVSVRKVENVASYVRFITDYPEVHRGNVVGLAEKSIRWHRHMQEHRTARMIDELGGDRPTMLPPAVLPDDARLRFLSSVADVVEEGQRMGHCVSSYARHAVHGHCYLFHVEYGGEEATIEVDPQGSVRQAYGPNNSSNKASEWGKRVLNKWGSNFLQQPTYALGD